MAVEAPEQPLLKQPVSTGAEERQPLLGKSLEELRELVIGMGEPRFRADQLHHWLYVRGMRDFEAMTNLKKEFRKKLAERFTIGALEIADKQTSGDGTVKYLFRLPNGDIVESVLMYFDERDVYAICLSSQVGCAVNCSFCATAKLGFMRNLSVAEIVEQFMFVQSDSGKEIRNIVLMGQGEPLLNYDNVMGAIRILNRSAEVGARRITLSTSGIVPRIYDLAKEDIQITLAVSLHAPDDDTREKIMPINRKWPIAELMVALYHYVEATNRRVTIEYILIENINDTVAHADALGRLLADLKCNINLIPYNPIDDEYGFKKPSAGRVAKFMDTVAAFGKKVTVRVERGSDIAAACGQLANKHQNASCC